MTTLACKIVIIDNDSMKNVIRDLYLERNFKNLCSEVGILSLFTSHGISMITHDDVIGIM